VRLHIGEMLQLLSEARDVWPYGKGQDPGVGVHSFDKFDLFITKHQEKSKNKGKEYKRYLLLFGEDTISMSENWDSFHANMTNHPNYEIQEENEENMPPEKSAMNDAEEREKFRLKCKNDWDLDLNPDQISMGIIEQEKTGCSIWHNQLYPNVRKSKKKITLDNGRYEWVERETVLWDKTIDGYRKMAAESGLFAGVDPPKFSTEADPKGGVEDLVARVTVYRLGPDGKRHPYTGEARFGEFVQMIPEYSNGKKTGKKVPNNIWSNSPNNQLAVAAERQALRKAFQDCSDGTPAAAPVFDGDRHVADDTSEPAPRGERAQDHASEPETHQATEPSPSRTPETEPAPAPEPEEEKPQGKYVGIPQSGFQVYAKYNRDERVILMAKKDGFTILALDSGARVTVSDSGYEVNRRDRTDNQRGGRKWSEGDEYYDGSKVLKISGSKKDKTVVRLLLDSNFKVQLDRWGKETRRRKVEPEPKKENGTHPDAKPRPASTSGYIDTTAEVKESKPAPQPETAATQEAQAPGNNREVDVESITDVAQLRKVTIPVFRDYCTKIVGRKVGMKEVYKEFTGVIIPKGTNMGPDDFRVLYEMLVEQLEEHDKNGGQPG